MSPPHVPFSSPSSPYCLRGKAEQGQDDSKKPHPGLGFSKPVPSRRLFLLTKNSKKGDLVEIKMRLSGVLRTAAWETQIKEALELHSIGLQNGGGL